MVSIFYVYLNGFYRWTAFLSALALMTRPDALLFLVPLAADRCWRILRRKPNRHHDQVAEQAHSKSQQAGRWHCRRSFVLRYSARDLACICNDLLWQPNSPLDRRQEPGLSLTARCRLRSAASALHHTSAGTPDLWHELDSYRAGVCPVLFLVGTLRILRIINDAPGPSSSTRGCT